MSERRIENQRIPISPSLALTLQITTILQIGDDALHRPLSDSNIHSYFA